MFLHHLSVGEYITGAKLLSFSKMSPMFFETGVAPNATDEKCATWLADLACKPLASRLRADGDPGSEALRNFCGPFLQELQAMFSGAPSASLRQVLSSFQDVELLLAATSPQSPTPPRPSLVRSALGRLGSLDKRSALSLALAHGPTGQRLIDDCQHLVAKSAEDSVGRESVMKATDALANMVSTGLSEQGHQLLVDLASGMRKLTPVSKEELLTNLQRASADMNRILENSFGTLLNDFIEEWVGFATAALDQVRRHEEGVGQGVGAGASTGDGTLMPMIKAEHHEEYDAPTMQPLKLPIVFTAQLLKFIPEVVRVKAKLEAESSILKGFAIASAKALQVARDALASSGLQPDTLGELKVTHTVVEKRTCLAIAICDVFLSFEAFGPDRGGAPLGEALRQHLDADTGARHEPGVVHCTSPVLSQILDSAKSAADLARMLTSAGHVCDRLAEHADFMKLLRLLSSSAALKLCSNACGSIIDGILCEVMSASHMHRIMPQDQDTISKLQNFIGLQSMFHMLIGAQGKDANDPKDSMLADMTVRILQADRDGDGGDSEWPHTKPTELAKQCLNLLVDHPDVVLVALAIVKACIGGSSKAPHL